MKLPLIAALAYALTAPGPALAQYKVVQPDGSVTYTDRPPAASNAKITALRGRQAAPAAEAGSDLPFDLRQVAQRYPVTLYTATDCPPCDAGRSFLQERGVPYAEKRINGEEDGAALERLVGGRTVPSITIGQQALRGLSQAEWASYLDAAGYPATSRLPRTWQPPAATPLVERVAPASRTAAAPSAPPPPAAEPAAPAAPSGGIRF